MPAAHAAHAPPEKYWFAGQRAAAGETHQAALVAPVAPPVVKPAPTVEHAAHAAAAPEAEKVSAAQRTHAPAVRYSPAAHGDIAAAATESLFRLVHLRLSLLQMA